MGKSRVKNQVSTKNKVSWNTKNKVYNDDKKLDTPRNQDKLNQKELHILLLLVNIKLYSVLVFKEDIPVSFRDLADIKTDKSLNGEELHRVIEVVIEEIPEELKRAYSINYKLSKLKAEDLNKSRLLNGESGNTAKHINDNISDLGVRLQEEQKKMEDAGVLMQAIEKIGETPGTKELLDKLNDSMQETQDAKVMDKMTLMYQLTSLKK